MITKTQKLALDIYKDQFSTAINQQYICGVVKEKFDEVLSIYREITGDMYNFKLGCGNCVLDLYKKVGKLYFEYEEPEEIINELPKKNN